MNPVKWFFNLFWSAPMPPSEPAPSEPLNATQEAGLAQAAEIAQPFEGERLEPYLDVNGTWTIGDGATHDLTGNPVTAGTPPITHAQAMMLLMRDMREAAVQAAKELDVAMTPAQWASVDDFIFNLGIGAFERGSVCKDILAGNFGAAADACLQYDHAGGVVYAGLLRRRQVEADMLRG
jgi:lysozyme